MQVLSDQTWTEREGSTIHDNIYNGQMYNSQTDRPNWSRAASNDSLSAWIMPESLPSPIDGAPTGFIVLQDMPPIRAGSDALHFEVMVDDFQQSYLSREDIGEIKDASLTNGGILKPIAMWSSDSGRCSVV